MEKFWMLLVDGTTTCSRKHLTLSGAQEEAARLLNQPQNQGKRVHLLESIGYGVIGHQPVRWQYEKDYS